MPNNLEKRGKYELFETSKGNQILNLNNKEFYAVIEGKKGEILVRSDSDHKKKKTVRKGKFFLADFTDDKDFRDVPHLFLQESKQQYREWILPRGVPTGKDHQKKLVRTDSKVSGAKIKSRTSGSGKKSGSKQELAAMSKTDLYNLAKRKNIEGRSKMDKDELIQALNKA